MCENRNTADAAHQCKCFGRFQSGVCHVCRSAVGQIPVECLLNICDVARGDHRVRHMGTSHLTRRTRPNIVPFDGHTKFAQAFNDLTYPLCTERRLVRHPLDQRRRSHRWKICKQMHRSVRDLHREFDSGKDSHAKTITGLTRFAKPVHGVVVGERHGRHPRLRGVFHQLRGRQMAVGGRGMAVKVDEGHAAIGYRAMARIRRDDNVQQVYSTQSGRVPVDRSGRAAPRSAAAVQGGPPKDGVVRVSRTSAGRGGKTVTLVTGVPGGEVTDVAARLKKLCGSGGTVKDGVIEIQGDHREKVASHLSETYRTKVAGG